MGGGSGCGRGVSESEPFEEEEEDNETVGMMNFGFLLPKQGKKNEGTEREGEM